MPTVDDAAHESYLKIEAGRLMASLGDATPSPPCDAQPEELDVAGDVPAVAQRVRRLVVGAGAAQVPAPAPLGALVGVAAVADDAARPERGSADVWAWSSVFAAAACLAATSGSLAAPARSTAASRSTCGSRRGPT